MRMLRGIVDVVSKNDPERLEPVLQNMASAVGQLLARTPWWACSATAPKRRRRSLG